MINCGTMGNFRCLCWLYSAIMICNCTAVMAQDTELERSVLALTGASSMEDLDEEVMEGFSSLASRQLRVNFASEARMVSSGLFSRYQAASIVDYRRRNGDILSLMELMLVDGFDESTARALAPFVSFDSSGMTAGNSVETESMVRSSARWQDGGDGWNYAAKVRVGDDDRWTAGIAAKSGYGDGKWPPEALSGSMGLYGRGGRWSIVAGDFNTRFGQGLVQWSGFSLSGAQSAAAFARHPSGISPAWTLSPSAVHRGMAVEARFGRTVTSLFASSTATDSPLSFGANVTWLARYGQIGLTGISQGRVSADWRWSFGKIDSFGELAYDASGNASAGIIGCTYNPDYQVRVSALARSYAPSYDGNGAGAFRSSTKTSDEAGGALALDYRKLVFTADMAFHPSKATSQHKAVLKYSPQISENCEMGFKLTSRFRPCDTYVWRNELRAEISRSFPSGFSLRGCGDVCRCRSFSGLAFCEAGYRNENSSKTRYAYARVTLFDVENWDDRIYIYERDIQGAFSVPAYYGRGWSFNIVTMYKWKGRAAVCLRFSYLDYPWMTEKKPGKAELKFQLLVWNLQFHSRFDVG